MAEITDQLIKNWWMGKNMTELNTMICHYLSNLHKTDTWVTHQYCRYVCKISKIECEKSKRALFRDLQNHDRVSI